LNLTNAGSTALAITQGINIHSGGLLEEQSRHIQNPLLKNAVHCAVTPQRSAEFDVLKTSLHYPNRLDLTKPIAMLPAIPMKKLFTVLLLSLAPFALSLGARPNIVFILADDLGYSELGSYGQKKIKTPYLDKLAKQGMRFTANYCGNAVCAPSRCVLMTGKHPGHAIVRNNRSMKSVGEPEGQHPIPASEVTIAELLKTEGYACGAFGKWGLGNTWSEGNPTRQGFDRFFGFNCQGHAHSYYPATLWSNNEKIKLNNNPEIPGHASLPEDADENDPQSYDAFKGQDYAPDRINEQALEFIRRHQDEPFFLYYPTVIPHVALHVPDEELKPYLALKWNDPPFTRRSGYGYTPHFTPRAAYAAMITRMDRYIGNILKLLKELKLEDNTIVVFTSDNGTTHLKEEVDFDFFESVTPLRGLKGSLYEGGIRVPLIVRWPGQVKPNTKSAYQTGFEDWMPTLLDLINANTKAPAGTDGISIAPTLLGKKQKARKFLYREFGGYGGQQAVWMGKWKGIRQNIVRKSNKTPLKIELFDLKKDISESTDVAAKNPKVLARIEKLMTEQHAPSDIFKMAPIETKK
jgi:arylsulfatase A-like enzyme